MTDVAASSASSAGAAGTYAPGDFQQNVQYAEMEYPNPPKIAVHQYSLPDLPYAYNALEPAISEAIMTLHHDRHHQAYVTNLNAALTSYADAATIADQVALLQNIKFNGGGHINHALFWRNLAPTTSEDAQNPEARAPKLAAAVAATYGFFDGLIDRFSSALNKVQGSGWGWLVRTSTPDGGLRIVTTKDQDPIVGDEVPIIGIDVWEHAYYLQYMNARPKYIDAVWSVINWTEAEVRYTGSRDAAFSELLATVQANP
ncbi:superoxide dismutase [Plectosphaerella cucumerina]|uniref:Superoxide dismutase n=1 Tax=Plectosphaerella cucumerina TaxID=40658 RepID=A0A8K0TKZ0_9PEZI|nr:superoxide dismutase [Plectosphaerella cucumerina]